MQGQTSGMGSGIAAGLSVVAIAEILAIATAAARFLARRTTRISDSAYLRSPTHPPRQRLEPAQRSRPSAV
jgi:hypothetical protein